MQLKQNTFIRWAKENIAFLKEQIKIMKKEVTYYYVLREAIYERECIDDFFSLTNGEIELSFSEGELINMGAIKHFYGTED